MAALPGAAVIILSSFKESARSLLAKGQKENGIIKYALLRVKSSKPLRGNSKKSRR